MVGLQSKFQNFNAKVNQNFDLRQKTSIHKLELLYNLANLRWLVPLVLNAYILS